MDSAVDLSSLEFNKYIGVTNEYLNRLFEKLGSPGSDLDNNSFWIMIDELINTCSVMFPEEAKDFIEYIKFERTIEKSLPELVRTGGLKKSVAYPAHFTSMVRVFFPRLRLNDRKFTSKFINRYPIFNASNYT